ncbi:DNA repair protein RAD51 [Perkinsela sp. CCAP 1560/4]|nr:DNA repair protein RAD51 [Perkinsela sp. CCAP 1560/4]|eukprot:KNH09412.1 DNA repair protein RAD51 [Perkinsela sp. CCAP 1560/4]
MDIEKLSEALLGLPFHENIKQQLLRKLKEQKISSLEELVTLHVTSPCLLGEVLLNIVSIEEWESILFYLCGRLIPRRTDWILDQNKLSSGSTTINGLLQGGFVPGHTYDLYGEAGTGKSTLVMQACVNVAKHYGCALYFAIETFSYNRLIQLGEALCETTKCVTKDSRFLENFILCQVSDWRTLSRRISDVESIIHIRKERGTPLRLLAFDSIAALQSIASNDQESANSNMPSYKDLMGKIQKVAFSLKRLCAAHDIALVFVNQVRGINGLTVPALGVSWANTIQTRLLLTKSESNQRSVSVIYSTYLPPGNAPFHLENAGFRP